jgi:TldD protein
METNRSWSINDRRLNFQLGTEIGYEIRGGKLGWMLQNCTYTGMTPPFWRSCDAVCNHDHWEVWETPSCGKGRLHTPGTEQLQHDSGTFKSAR